MVSVLVFQIFDRLETSYFHRPRRNQGFCPWAPSPKPLNALTRLCRDMAQHSASALSPMTLLSRTVRACSKKNPAPECGQARGKPGAREPRGTITTRRIRNNTPRARAVNCLAPIATNKKGRPESRPLPSPLRTDARRRGIQRLSPFKARPKGLQRGGCITMTLRINAVNPVVFGLFARANARDREGRFGQSVSADSVAISPAAHVIPRI